MKTQYSFCICVLLLFIDLTVKADFPSTKIEALKDSSCYYKDGKYEGFSKASYTSEPYWGHVKLTVDKGYFTHIEFSIRDSSFHEFVDSLYGINHFATYPDYIKQCVNDGHGIEVYPQRLLESQNTNKVDAITGATWSYNIFKASVKEALKSGQITSVAPIDKSEGIIVNVLPGNFSSQVEIEYVIPNDGYVTLQIFDIQGRMLSTLVGKKLPKGKHMITWNDCPGNGLYYYCLINDTKQATGRFLKVK